MSVLGLPPREKFALTILSTFLISFSVHYPVMERLSVSDHNGHYLVYIIPVQAPCMAKKGEITVPVI